MKILNKLEKKFGKYAIWGLMRYIICIYVLGYLLMMMQPAILSLTQFDAALICKGQIWRLVTYILTPDQTNLLWFVLLCYVYYNIGNMIEGVWGAFRFNLYIFSGILLTSIGGVIYYLLTGSNIVGWSTTYVNQSLFLALAMIYPDMEFLLFFIFPVKVKWLAILDAIFIGVSIVSAIGKGQWAYAMLIVMALLNFIIYFFATKNYKGPVHAKRRRQYQQSIKQAQMTMNQDGTIFRHKCSICGKTEHDDEELEFRFCSKCKGTHEYCQHHLFSHEHK